MNKRKFISWRRVSTARQSKSGLGLEAQSEIIRYFVEREGGVLIADYSECYTGKELSGCVELQKAMKHAKSENAILIIAKSDRFRNCQEALAILDEMGEGNIEFCDLPHSDRFTLTLFWALAEREALIVSIRTKQALAAKKARGEKLGAASDKYNISKENLRQRALNAGATRTRRALESRDTATMIKIMKQVFHDCADNPENEWQQSYWNTRHDDRIKFLTLMKNYKEISDDGLFAKWDLSDIDNDKLAHKLASKLQSIVKMLTNA